MFQDLTLEIGPDNPINQTLLSTFMRKKKIKYDVAKNGEEAVEKWRSGRFHLILVRLARPKVLQALSHGGLVIDGYSNACHGRHLRDQRDPPVGEAERIAGKS